MEEFRRAYARLCAAGGAAPQEAVLRRLRELGGAPGRGRLDLAAQSLSLETCGALGRLLPGAAPFAEVALGDCGLSEEGGRGARGGGFPGREPARSAQRAAVGGRGCACGAAPRSRPPPPTPGGRRRGEAERRIGDVPAPALPLRGSGRAGPPVARGRRGRGRAGRRGAVPQPASEWGLAAVTVSRWIWSRQLAGQDGWRRSNSCFKQMNSPGL
ncbi:uncharacterized protein J5F26_012166 isoform 2-T3 [Ciconia maguari]